MCGRYLLLILGVVVTMGRRTESIPLPDVLFVHHGTTIMATSRWFVTLTIDLHPYKALCSTMWHHIMTFESWVQTTLADLYEIRLRSSGEFFNSTQGYMDRVKAMIANEIRKLELEALSLHELYKDLRASFLGPETRRRGKRSILGFLSPVLTGLFGIPSESDWHIAENNIHSLMERSGVIESLLSQSVQTMNATIIEVKVNRQAIKALTSTVDQMKNGIAELKINLQQEMLTSRMYYEVVNQAHAIVHLLTSELRSSTLALLLLKTDLMYARQGGLASTLVSPRDLTTVLIQIEQSLPSQFSLPFAITQTDQYYSELSLIMINNHSSIALALNVPLKRQMDAFELLQVQQVPSEYKNQKNMWELESNFFALSINGEELVLLTRAEAEICRRTFCPLNKPRYNSHTMPSCLLALYHSNTQTISNHCKLINSPLSPYPAAQHMFGTTWLLEGAKNEVIDFDCVEPLGREGQRSVFTDRRSSIVHAQFQVVEIPEMCRIVSRVFQTPTTLRGSSEVIIRRNVSLNFEFPLPEIPLPIVVDGRSVEANLSLPNLPNLPNMDGSWGLEEIRRGLDKLKEKDNYQMVPEKHRDYLMVGTVIISALIIILFLVYAICKCKSTLLFPFPSRHESVMEPISNRETKDHPLKETLASLLEPGSSQERTEAMSSSKKAPIIHVPEKEGNQPVDKSVGQGWKGTVKKGANIRETPGSSYLKLSLMNPDIDEEAEFQQNVPESDFIA